MALQTGNAAARGSPRVHAVALVPTPPTIPFGASASMGSGVVEVMGEVESNKRGRIDPGIATPLPDDLSFSQGSFDQLFKNALANSGLQGECEKLCRDVSQAAYTDVANRITTLEDVVTDVKETMATHVADFGDFKAEVLQKLDALAKAPSAHAAPPPMQRAHANGNSAQSSDFQGPGVTDDGFFRTPDPTILFCNIFEGAKVTRTKFQMAISILAAEANIHATDFKLVGDELDDRFEIRFEGAHATAKACCLQFFQSLQLGRGKWKVQQVKNELGVSCQFFVGPDKNPARIRLEVFSKGIKDIVQTLLPNKVVFVKKATGTIFVDRRRIVTLFLVGEHATRLDWDHSRRVALGLDDAIAETQFKEWVEAKMGSFP